MARHLSEFVSSLLVEDLAARYYVPPMHEEDPPSMRSPSRSGIYRRAVALLRDLLGRKTRHYRARTDRAHRSLREWAEDESLPSAMVVAKSVDVFADAGGQEKVVATLDRNHPIESVLEKKKVDGDWWYRIRFVKDGTTVKGWVPSSAVTEIADPDAFEFSSAGGTGSGSPFKKLRTAVKDAKIQPNIARHINYMNGVLLPHLDWSLDNFVAGAFYHALVEGKGNFKKASLITTAAYRAHKPSSTESNVYPWVQRGDPKAAFKMSDYRDKLWHFFWNAYMTFDGDGAAYTKGLIYELKSREDPIESFIALAPLDDDVTADIVFNDGGIKFAKWIDDNREAVLEHMFDDIADELRASIAADPELSKIPADKVDGVVLKAMASEDVQTEIKKRAYQIFADYAGAYVQVVLKVLEEHMK